MGPLIFDTTTFPWSSSNLFSRPKPEDLIGAPEIGGAQTATFSAVLPQPIRPYEPITEVHVYKVNPGQTISVFTDYYESASYDQASGELGSGELYSEFSLRNPYYPLPYIFDADPSLASIGLEVDWRDLYNSVELPDPQGIPSASPPSGQTAFSPSFSQLTIPLAASPYLYLALYGHRVPETIADGWGDPGRYIVTTRADEIEEDRAHFWGEDWLQFIPGELFTDEADTVNFNALTDQQARVLTKSVEDGFPVSIYQASDGNDIVMLPEPSGRVSYSPFIGQVLA